MVTRRVALVTYIVLTFALPLHHVNDWLMKNERALAIWGMVWLAGLAGASILLALQWWSSFRIHRGYGAAWINTVLLCGLVLYIAYGMISSAFGVI